MNASARPVRQELDLQRFSDITLANLMNCFASLRPGAQEADFIQGILTVVGTRDDPSIETPLEIIKQFITETDRAKGDDWIASAPIGSVLMSCTYCLRAMRAMKAGDSNLAWSYMADARYWCGVSISCKGIDEAREQTIITTSEKASAEAITSRAKSGGEGRSKVYEPIREYVYQLARERRPMSGWRSRSHAVKVISEDAYKFSKERGPALKKEGIGKTLDTWLASMPDAASL